LYSLSCSALKLPECSHVGIIVHAKWNFNKSGEGWGEGEVVKLRVIGRLKNFLFLEAKDSRESESRSSDALFFFFFKVLPDSFKMMD